MTEPRDAALRALEARIRAAQDKAAPPPPKEEHYSQAQHAWRMVVELVAGLMIGFGIGYGLDVLFGTLPILLVVFTLLGFAAGVQTMVRTAREYQDRQAGIDPGDGRRPGIAPGDAGTGRTGQGSDDDRSAKEGDDRGDRHDS